MKSGSHKLAAWRGVARDGAVGALGRAVERVVAGRAACVRHGVAGMRKLAVMTARACVPSAEGARFETFPWRLVPLCVS